MTTIIDQPKDDAIKEHHLKRLQKLSEDSIGVIPHLDDLTEEQEQWVERSMKAPAWTWKTWDSTEERK